MAVKGIGDYNNAYENVFTEKRRKMNGDTAKEIFGHSLKISQEFMAGVK